MLIFAIFMILGLAVFQITMIGSLIYDFMRRKAQHKLQYLRERSVYRTKRIQSKRRPRFDRPGNDY